MPAAGIAQTKVFPLDSPNGITLHNLNAAPVTFKGKKALKLTSSLPPPPAGNPGAKKGGGKKGGGPAGEGPRAEHLAVAGGVEFGNGTIEVDLTGEPGPGAAGGARGFVGVAFRVQPDLSTYDCFYVRPTNGRAEDQERRNHTAQYVSHPGFPWFKLREETPSKYESYVDIGPAEWIRLKIDVEGDKARLFVNGNSQPTLIVNDVKSGAPAKGGVALWIEGSTIAHFANLKIAAR
ncbi:MAG: hypothetical protein FJW39_06770 [Acidobacteria bacterium]|nr:hypothetical protein [Acidobacteriota bacterium]